MEDLVLAVEDEQVGGVFGGVVGDDVDVSGIEDDVRRVDVSKAVGQRVAATGADGPRRQRRLFADTKQADRVFDEKPVSVLIPQTEVGRGDRLADRESPAVNRVSRAEESGPTRDADGDLGQRETGGGPCREERDRDLPA